MNQHDLPEFEIIPPDFKKEIEQVADCPMFVNEKGNIVDMHPYAKVCRLALDNYEKLIVTEGEEYAEMALKSFYLLHHLYIQIGLN